MKRQDGLARVADTLAENKGRGGIWAQSAGPLRRSVGRGNAVVPDKRERQSHAISKRPITGERSWKKKIARENRDSFVAGEREEGRVRRGMRAVRASGWDEIEN